MVANEPRPQLTRTPRGTSGAAVVVSAGMAVDDGRIAPATGVTALKRAPLRRMPVPVVASRSAPAIVRGRPPARSRGKLLHVSGTR